MSKQQQRERRTPNTRFDESELNRMTVDELRTKAKELDVSGASAMDAAP